MQLYRLVRSAIAPAVGEVSFADRVAPRGPPRAIVYVGLRGDAVRQGAQSSALKWFQEMT